MQTHAKAVQPQTPAPAQGPSLSRSTDAAAPTIVSDVLRSYGQPLDAGTRTFMEPHFGYDFGRVRVHADGQAAKAARTVNALAFTVGRDVIFDSQQYVPHTQSGRRLIAHELAHVVQQDGTTLVGRQDEWDRAPQTRLRMGGISDEAETAAERAAGQVMAGKMVTQLGSSALVIRRQARQPREILGLEEFDRGAPQPTSPARFAQDDLLEALRAHEYRRFSQRLHSLHLWERQFARHDEDFLRQLEALLPPGRVLWNALLVLWFGNDLPSYVAQLRAAVYAQDASRVIRLLRSHPNLTDERQVPGVALMLAYEFRGRPEYEAVIDVATQPVWSERAHHGTAEEAHYEYNRTTRSYEIQRFRNRIAYTIARTATELRVITRIRFKRSSDPGNSRARPGRELYFVPEAKLAEWRAGIDSVWNNRFSASNGTDRLQIIFQPVFDNTEQNPDFDVVIMDEPTFQRSNETHWWLHADGRAAAHEFGHMLGNPDEYNLPGGIAEFPAEVCFPGGTGCAPLSPADQFRNSIEGLTMTERPPQRGGYDLPTIMGSGRAVRRRHVLPVLDWFNANMLLDNEAPFELVPRS